MAYVCNVDEVGGARPSAPVAKASLVARLARVPGALVEWLAAWNEAADEAALARRTFGNCGGKLTDGLEREMMRRVLRTE